MSERIREEIDQIVASLIRREEGLSQIDECQIPVNGNPEVRKYLEMLTKPPFSNCENGFEILRKHGVDPKLFGGDSKDRIPATLAIYSDLSYQKNHTEIAEAKRILNNAGLLTTVVPVEGHMCEIHILHFRYYGVRDIEKLVEPDFNPR